MRWIEIIMLRTTREVPKFLCASWLNRFEETDEHFRLKEIRVFRQQNVRTDFHIRIEWESQEQFVGKTPLGMRLGHMLRTFGLVSHSVWTPMETHEFKIGEIKKKQV